MHGNWEQLGLTSELAERYEQLLRGSTEPSDADTALAALGLVHIGQGRTIPYRPSTAIGGLLTRRRAELDTIDRDASDLDHLWEFGRQNDQPGSRLYTIISGRQAIRTSIESLVAAAQHSIDIVDAPPYVAEPASDMAELEAAAHTRGVTFRLVAHSSALDSPPHVADLLRSARAGQHVKTTTRRLPKYIIADHTRLLVPLSLENAHDEPSAAIVLDDHMLDVYTLLFEHLHESSIPLIPPPPAPHPAEADATQLFALLAAGLSDHAICHQLSISDRTLRRRVAELQHQHGARTRFQLATLLAAEGDPSCERTAKFPY